jgi:hypothetical protein
LVIYPVVCVLIGADADCMYAEPATVRHEVGIMTDSLHTTRDSSFSRASLYFSSFDPGHTLTLYPGCLTAAVCPISSVLSSASAGRQDVTARVNSESAVQKKAYCDAYTSMTVFSQPPAVTQAEFVAAVDTLTRIFDCSPSLCSQGSMAPFDVANARNPFNGTPQEDTIAWFLSERSKGGGQRQYVASPFFATSTQAGYDKRDGDEGARKDISGQKRNEIGLNREEDEDAPEHPAWLGVYSRTARHPFLGLAAADSSTTQEIGRPKSGATLEIQQSTKNNIIQRKLSLSSLGTAFSCLSYG